MQPLPAATAAHTQPPTRPEDIRYGKMLWLIAIAIEVCYQLATMVSRFVNPSDLIALASKTSQADTGPGQLRLVVYLTIVLAGTTSLAILGFVAWAVVTATGGGKKAKNFRLLLVYMSVFFGVRAIMLFAAPAISSDPTWVQALLGGLQIASAAAAIMGTSMLFTSAASDYIKTAGNSDTPPPAGS